MEPCHHCGEDSRLVDKLEKLTEKISLLNNTITRHEVSVSSLVERITEIESEIIPIKKHFLMVEGGVKLIGIFALVITIAVGVFTLFHQ